MDNKHLSDTWRVNRSQVPVVELAQAIRALAKLAGSVSSDVKAIKFNTTKSSGQRGDKESNTIVIDPTFALREEYPIPPDDFDILAGLAVHEAAHLSVGSAIIETDHITGRLGISGKGSRHTKLLLERASQITLCNRPFNVGEMLSVGEEVYTDRWLGRHFPIQSKYLLKSRRAYNTGDENIDWTDPFEAWKAISVYGHMPSMEMPEDALKALSIMTRLSKDLAMQDNELNERVGFYLAAWKELTLLSQQQQAEEIAHPKTQSLDVSAKSTVVRSGDGSGSGESNPDGDATGGSETKEDEEDTAEQQGDKAQEDKGDEGEAPDSEEDDENGDGEGDEEEGDDGPPEPTTTEPATDDKTSQDNSLPIAPIASIDPDLASRIAEALDMESTDITDALAQLLAEVPPKADEKRPATIWQRAITPIDKTFDEALYRDLLWIKELKNTIGIQVWHGEKRGRIDQPRLYRAAIDGGAFKVRRKTPLKEINLVLLLDASSSMMNRTSIYECAKSLHKVIPEATVLTYSDVNEGVVISVQGERQGIFREVRTAGQTPSGLAILAAAMKFPDSMIIHFTDGETNVGPLPTDVLKLMEEKFPKVQVVNILYGHRRTYGNDGPNYSDVAISDIAEFPEKLKAALKPWYMGGYKWNTI